MEGREVRTGRPSSGDPLVLAVFAAKRRRYFLGLGVVIIVHAFILVIWTVRPYIAHSWSAFVVQGLLGIISVVTLGGVFLFELYDFYCPACGKGLGLSPWAQFCPRCATRLSR